MFLFVYFLHFLIDLEYTLLMKNQLDATLGRLSNLFYYAIFKMQSLTRKFKKFLSQHLGYTET